MTRWHCTNLWWQHWRKFINSMKDESRPLNERVMYARAAMLANASYVIALAEEKASEARN